MTDILFRPLVARDLPELMKWHRNTELSRRYGGVQGPETMFHLMQTNARRLCLVAHDDANTLGYIDMEKIPEKYAAWVGLVVNPQHHNKGYGKSILKKFLTSEYVLGLREIYAGIEHDNEPSLRCFRAVGFAPTNETPDEEGILNFIYTL